MTFRPPPLPYSSDFRESTDGRAIVATFELPNVAKEDIHISFQRNRLLLTWETGEIYQWEEDGVVYRERIKKMYHRTLPLPEGTRVCNRTLGVMHGLFIDFNFFVVWRDSCSNDEQTPYTEISQYAMLSSREPIKIWWNLSFNTVLRSRLKLFMSFLKNRALFN